MRVPLREALEQTRKWQKTRCAARKSLNQLAKSLKRPPSTVRSWISRGIPRRGRREIQKNNALVVCKTCKSVRAVHRIVTGADKTGMLRKKSKKNVSYRVVCRETGSIRRRVRAVKKRKRTLNRVSPQELSTYDTNRSSQSQSSFAASCRYWN